MIPGVIKNLLVKIEQSGFEGYLVGGFVRDALLYRKTNDIDIATNALPKDLTILFGPSLKTEMYGSYHLKIEQYTVDITTYRKEIRYEKGRLSEMVYSSNMVEDAKRRDFTMNAIYMNKNEEIIDLYDGRKDLKEKKLKMIGNPVLRLEEDPIRILRAVRFASMYHLEMDKSLKKAILKTKKNLENASIVKIRKELDGILLADGFSLLKKLGLLKELGIMNQKVVFVEDLSGLWAQIKTNREYVVEKELKIRQKSIAEQLKCGTIKVLDLYYFGFYQCLTVAKILKFPVKKLEKMYQNMSIHSRKDIVLTADEIQIFSGVKGEMLGKLLKDLEEKIVLKKVLNTEESIQKFVKEWR